METEKLSEERMATNLLNRIDGLLKKQIEKNGTLFIIWGWVWCLTYVAEYIPNLLFITNRTQMLGDLILLIVFITASILTIYYLINRKPTRLTEAYSTVRYVWSLLVACLVLVNLIQYNVSGDISLKLQHPIFMVFIGFAIVITGKVLRYKLVITGGLLFIACAYACSFLDFPEQFLVEAIAWFMAFVLPGHMIYSKSK